MFALPKTSLAYPNLVVRPVAVTLGSLQRELYELLRSEAARAAAGMASRDRRFFRTLGRHVVRLIQAATNPMLLAQGALLDTAASDSGSAQKIGHGIYSEKWLGIETQPRLPEQLN